MIALREIFRDKLSWSNFQMSQLPETGFLRLPQIIGDPKAEPPIPPIIPVKKSCWWDGVKTGRFPKPVKLGPRVTAWRVEDIKALIAAA
ncbi:MAG: AlpA family phage regulatory protein [Rhodocyclaceae bacterium]|nr:AlpA family phage regulatory protein [Rhodocyclaceae bacterium]MDZ4213888.1 AlpA family phage regulatory protein [Rhodocyclaceae bacterium]